MQDRLNHLNHEYIKVNGKVKKGIIIMMEEHRRTELYYN